MWCELIRGELHVHPESSQEKIQLVAWGKIKAKQGFSVHVDMGKIRRHPEIQRRMVQEGKNES